jgi:pSer/pThr/pTyr-binding forkhead associated (FHA) protein
VAKLISPDQEWDLTPGQHTFGRKAENPIQIADPYVSGRHGEFTVVDQDIFLEDVGSTNGTLLNNRKLQAGEKVKLQPDDVIRLGSLELRVVWES